MPPARRAWVRKAQRLLRQPDANVPADTVPELRRALLRGDPLARRVVRKVCTRRGASGALDLFYELLLDLETSVTELVNCVMEALCRDPQWVQLLVRVAEQVEGEGHDVPDTPEARAAAAAARRRVLRPRAL